MQLTANVKSSSIGHERIVDNGSDSYYDLAVVLGPVVLDG